MKPYIYVRGVHVNFPLHLDESRSFRKTLVDAMTFRSKERKYKAGLSNINFTAKAGDRIALVGSNGSGKTTLLRALNGVYTPSEGVIYRRGSTAALINTTMGMDFFLSGLDNIFMRGTYMGLTKSEMAKHVDDIVDFAELGDDIFRPVRHYSSGMLARLAFGIATTARADIYLMDEWIGAGDARFFERAQKRIENMFNDDTILILASHSDALCHQWCNKGLVIEKGSPYLFSDVKHCTEVKNLLMKGEKPAVPVKVW